MKAALAVKLHHQSINIFVKNIIVFVLFGCHTVLSQFSFHQDCVVEYLSCEYVLWCLERWKLLSLLNCVITFFSQWTACIMLLNDSHVTAALAEYCIIGQSTWLFKYDFFHVWSELWLLNCIIEIYLLFMWMCLIMSRKMRAPLAVKLCDHNFQSINIVVKQYKFCIHMWISPCEPIITWLHV